MTEILLAKVGAKFAFTWENEMRITVKNEIHDVKFNTKEKAQKCLSLLGKRGIDIFSIVYDGTISGFWVRYWKK